jgi:3-dehydroquinate synthase/shikimate kinase/3-dehydroquinate synthase
VSRLILVGLPGVGKTTLAHELAERSGTAALDTDDILASAVGTSAAQYLRTEGEAAFRDREFEALTTALEGSPDVVIATGGGIVCSPSARAVLAEARTLWLDCDDAVILARLGDGDRPLLAEGPAATLSRLRGEREDWYREVSLARIDTSGPIDDVVADVEREVGRLTR